MDVKFETLQLKNVEVAWL